MQCQSCFQRCVNENKKDINVQQDDITMCFLKWKKTILDYELKHAVTSLIE